MPLITSRVIFSTPAATQITTLVLQFSLIVNVPSCVYCVVIYFLFGNISSVPIVKVKKILTNANAQNIGYFSSCGFNL